MPDNKTMGECCPDYEMEYYRLIEEVKSLKSENATLRETILGMCKCLFADRGSC